MRILAFSDSHENAVAVEAFLKRISSIGFVPDVFVSAGDIGPRSMVRIFQALSAMDRLILYVWGNHILHYPPSAAEECAHELAAIPHAIALTDRHVQIGAWTFVGQDAWTDFVDDPKDPERYYDLRRKTDGLLPHSTILVTHHAPLGIFDCGHSYPLRSYRDGQGLLHAGSRALRRLADEFGPRIHIFAHCHSDGSRHAMIGDTLFSNVCHLERITKSGRYGITGSFAIIDTESLAVTTYHLSCYSPRVCSGCGSRNYILYKSCVNCIRGASGLLHQDELP